MPAQCVYIYTQHTFAGIKGYRREQKTAKQRETKVLYVDNKEPQSHNPYLLDSEILLPHLELLRRGCVAIHH